MPRDRPQISNYGRRTGLDVSRKEMTPIIFNMRSSGQLWGVSCSTPYGEHSRACRAACAFSGRRWRSLFSGFALKVGGECLDR